jgi:hypothetical protein
MFSVTRDITKSEDLRPWQGVRLREQAHRRRLFCLCKTGNTAIAGHSRIWNVTVGTCPFHKKLKGGQVWMFRRG